MFLNSLNNFRAMAIVFIVAGHSFGLANIDTNNPIAKLIINFLSGGTFLFVFISGFLFHHVFYKKFKYNRFILGKAKTVLTPYLILGLLPVLFYVSLKKDVFGGFFLPSGEGWGNEYLIPALKYYWTGSFLNAYWYIPFILITFLCSPLHVAFIRSPFGIQVFTVIIFSLLSIYMHRPVDNLHVFQSVVYFMPVYLIGIFCSLNKDVIYSIFKNKDVYLLLLVAVFLGLQIYTGHNGNYHKEPFIYSGIDFMFFQKISLSLFFMVWLARFEHVKNKVLHTLASTSFAVFFMHPFILWVLNKFTHVFQTGAPWFVFMVIVLFVIGICICIAKLARALLPKASKYLIGY